MKTYPTDKFLSGTGALFNLFAQADNRCRLANANQLPQCDKADGLRSARATLVRRLHAAESLKLWRHERCHEAMVKEKLLDNDIKRHRKRPRVSDASAGGVLSPVRVQRTRQAMVSCCGVCAERAPCPS